MWRLGKDLVGKCAYVGQDVTFVGNIAAKIQSIYIGGEKVKFSRVPDAKSNNAILGFLRLYHIFNQDNISIAFCQSDHFHPSLS